MEQDLTGKKLLIIEDEPALLNALKDKFKKEGFSVLEARDGEQGLETALKEKPDVILLDIIMPNMDGITMLEKLREDEWGNNAKVIILTNLSSPESMMECIKNKSFDYLVKTNWKIDEIVTKVREVLAK